MALYTEALCYKLKSESNDHYQGRKSTILTTSPFSLLMSTVISTALAFKGTKAYVQLLDRYNVPNISNFVHVAVFKV